VIRIAMEVDGGRESKINACISYSVVVNYITSGRSKVIART
jgi:hypothetical protein